MRVERFEVCWLELRFESKSQRNDIFTNRLSVLSANPDFSKKNHSDWNQEALNMSKGLAVNRNPEDMVFRTS